MIKYYSMPILLRLVEVNHMDLSGIFICLMFSLQVMNLIGDVKGKVAVMVDDMIDTAGMPSSMPSLTFERSFFYCVFVAYNGYLPGLGNLT